MNLLEKTRILGESGSFDSCGPKACEVTINKGLGGIYHAKAEHQTCRLFKTLMNNSCSFDCKYCTNTASNQKKQKVAYEPEELANLFMHLNRKMAVDGLFLSSGVSGNPDVATEKMIQAISLLRNKYKYNGYVHFKVLPGTSYELIKQASEISTRMSINIESPNASILSELSSCKDYKTDILRRQAWIKKMNLPSGQTTQIILNHISTDKDVLKMVDWEYKNIELKRMYFSTFRPVQGTEMQNEKAENPTRANHLYNVDFLMRDYDFKMKEFESIFNDNNMLPTIDPKLALARANFDGRVDINNSSYDELIRVPGIGPKSAKAIVEKKEKIRKYEELQNIGVRVKIAKPFIEVDGKRQMSIWEF